MTQYRFESTSILEGKAGTPEWRAHFSSNIDSSMVVWPPAANELARGRTCFHSERHKKDFVRKMSTMALQMGLRRGATSLRSSNGILGTTSFDAMKRWKSTDAGDVIGIDLGTTNSCVAIMVSVAAFSCLFSLCVLRMVVSARR